MNRHGARHQRLPRLWRRCCEASGAMVTPSRSRRSRALEMPAAGRRSETSIRYAPPPSGCKEVQPGDRAAASSRAGDHMTATMADPAFVAAIRDVHHSQLQVRMTSAHRLTGLLGMATLAALSGSAELRRADARRWRTTSRSSTLVVPEHPMVPAPAFLSSTSTVISEA